MQLWEPCIRIAGNPRPGYPPPTPCRQNCLSVGAPWRPGRGVCAHMCWVSTEHPGMCVRVHTCVCARVHWPHLVCGSIHWACWECICVSLCVQVHPLTQHPHVRLEHFWVYEQVHTFRGWDGYMLLSKQVTLEPTASHYRPCIHVCLLSP